MNARSFLCGALAFPAVLGAQGVAERTGFYLLTGADTIFAERSVRTPAQLSGSPVR